MRTENILDSFILWFQPIAAVLVASLITLYLAVRYRREKNKVIEQARLLEESNQHLLKAYEDLNQTQKRLVESEKMAAIGQLIAGVTHELNNPISIIYTNMYHLRQYITSLMEIITEYEKFPLDDPYREKAHEIKNQKDYLFIQRDLMKLINAVDDSTQRVKRIVSDLRDFSRMEPSEPQKADIRKGLKNTVALIYNQFKTRILFHEGYDEIPETYCFPEQLNQVFMNIIMNACQAIPQKGNIWIHTEMKNSKIEITIQDDGAGIPPNLLDKIFNPFFTTKKVGEGTGLGLSISYGIVQKHQGEISVKSKPGTGSEFNIVLPVQAEQFNFNGTNEKEVLEGSMSSPVPL